MIIEIEKEIDATTKKVWCFTAIDLNFVFTYYYLLQKPVGKRKYTVAEKWDKYQKRASTIDEPVLPDEIRQLAYQKAVTYVKIKTWAEYKSA